MARQKFMNTEIDNLTMQEALETIDALIQENKNAIYAIPPLVGTCFLFVVGVICDFIYSQVADIIENKIIKFK